jgi:N-acetyl-alpha-D-muramate 1-phosphate uridylyltransferase
MTYARPHPQSDAAALADASRAGAFWRPRSVMVLAAGMGERMRPLTDHLPKPLVRLAGRPLIDHVLDRLATARVQQAVVNAHYCADALMSHLAARTASGAHPSIIVSDERGRLLDTGGGVKLALPLLGEDPFLVHNSDSVWLEDDRNNNLERMIAAWDATLMDVLLMLAPTNGSLGYSGSGDFEIAEDGSLTRRKTGERAPYVFAGVSIIQPRLFEESPDGPFSLNTIFDRAIGAKRLFGVIHQGLWMHVGTPVSLHEAEESIRNSSRT